MGIFSSLFSGAVEKLSGQGGDFGGQLTDIGRQAAKALGDKLDEGVNSAQVNLENAYKRLKPINDSNYPEFKRDPHSYLAREGILWFVRKDLEAARCYYSGGKEGYIASERVGSNGPALATPPFLLLKSEIEKTEEKVREMEQAKGYEFVRCQNNNIIFRELTHGEELSADASSRI